MAKIFKVFSTFYTGLFENIYALLDSFDVMGGDAFKELKEKIEKILNKVTVKVDIADE